MPVDSSTMFLKLSVNKRATTGGMTTAAAMRVTPKTCIDTTMVAAKIKENIVSTQLVGTP